MAVLVKKHKATFFPDETILNRKLIVHEGDTNVVIAFELLDNLGNNLLENCPSGTTVEAIFYIPEEEKVICPLNIMNNHVFIQYSIGSMESEEDIFGTLHLVKTNNSNGTLTSREVLPSIKLVIKKNPTADSLTGNLLVAQDGSYLITSENDYILLEL